MASAASDASLSPLSQQEETEGPQKEGPTDLFDDEEDDIAPRSKRKPAATVPTFDPEDSDRGELRDKEEEADNDLFGDDDGDDRAETGKRQLGDSELDSGDDEDRRDRAPDGEDASEDGVDQTMEEISMLPVELPRQQYPKSDDGEVYPLRFSLAYIRPINELLAVLAQNAILCRDRPYSLQRVDFPAPQDRPSFQSWPLYRLLCAQNCSYDRPTSPLFEQLR